MMAAEMTSAMTKKSIQTIHIPTIFQAHKITKTMRIKTKKWNNNKMKTKKMKMRSHQKKALRLLNNNNLCPKKQTLNASPPHL